MQLVALSGYGQDSDITAALAAGFDQHITKPPDPGRLEMLLAGRNSVVEEATWSDPTREPRTPPDALPV